MLLQNETYDETWEIFISRKNADSANFKSRKHGTLTVCQLQVSIDRKAAAGGETLKYRNRAAWEERRMAQN